MSRLERAKSHFESILVNVNNTIFSDELFELEKNDDINPIINLKDREQIYFSPNKLQYDDKIPTTILEYNQNKLNTSTISEKGKVSQNSYNINKKTNSTTSSRINKFKITTDRVERAAKDGDYIGLTSEEKDTLIVTLKEEVDRLKLKLTDVINRAELTITDAQFTQEDIISEHQVTYEMLKENNNLLVEENKKLKELIEESNKNLNIERSLLFRSVRHLERQRHREKELRKLEDTKTLLKDLKKHRNFVTNEKTNISHNNNQPIKPRISN